MDPEDPSGKSEAESASHTEPGSQKIAELFDYPSIGRLFDVAEPQRFEILHARLCETRENLERVVRHGGADEAARAAKAVRAVEITLDFLQTLRELRGDK